MITRRLMMAGALAGLAAPVRADDKSPLAHGVLADNSLARAFEPSPRDELPSVSFWGPNGRVDFDEYKGRAILMPLWAEWCAPCLSELPDFARLQRKYGNDKFAIVPVLTGTRKAFTPQSLGGFLRAAHGEVFEPLIEVNRGDWLVQKMARRSGGSSALPCNLIIAPSGKVMGREIGRIENSDDDNPAKTAKEVMARVDADAVQSRWGQKDGEDFAKAMADGFLA
jgi:thiol-disulfide isomerase/thioredoxin